MQRLEAALCLESLHATPIDAQPNRFVGRNGLQQGLHEDRALALAVDMPILQRIVDAGPATFEEHRQRQFCQAACVRLTQQRIAHDERGKGLLPRIHLVGNSGYGQ